MSSANTHQHPPITQPPRNIRDHEASVVCEPSSTLHHHSSIMEHSTSISRNSPALTTNSDPPSVIYDPSSFNSTQMLSNRSSATINHQASIIHHSSSTTPLSSTMQDIQLFHIPPSLTEQKHISNIIQCQSSILDGQSELSMQPSSILVNHQLSIMYRPTLIRDHQTSSIMHHHTSSIFIFQSVKKQSSLDNQFQPSVVVAER